MLYVIAKSLLYRYYKSQNIISLATYTVHKILNYFIFILLFLATDGYSLFVHSLSSLLSSFPIETIGLSAAPIQQYPNTTLKKYVHPFGLISFYIATHSLVGFIRQQIDWFVFTYCKFSHLFKTLLGSI